MLKPAPTALLLATALFVVPARGYIAENGVDDALGVPLQHQRVLSKEGALVEGLVELARQSTILKFDFNNLMLLIAIKFVVLFIAGYIGYLGGFTGRSSDLTATSWVDRTDALFALAFLMGEEEEKGQGERGYSCLNRMACLDDVRAHDFLVASKMIFNGAKYLQPVFGYPLERYDRIVYGLQDAVDYRRLGGDCNALYRCSSMPSL
ncbi:uncharacterized protein LOC143034846 [Oratosquilla oratoria]|uniref:uncharacterized protein LOC143034846 n=1 Tax=Oratosquilla oratoria TaxID=337810 RepID=UPI003F770B7B